MTDDELAALIDHAGRRAEVSAVALTETLLTRIEGAQPLFNAFVTLTPELALADARRADAARAGGEPLPLDGLPIAVKDNIDVAGVLTTVGSRLFADRIAAEDAEAVHRLRAAGAVVLGKTLLHELAFGVTSNNPFYGTCRNPWDPERIPGGSSGGSAAALAADLCVGALGSDTGGSGRIPAHLVGVSGLRPTFGAVSNRGVVPLAWSLDTVAPMARSVADVARLLAAAAGYDPADPRSVERPPLGALSCLDGGLAGLRVGLPERYFFEDLDSEVERHARAAVAVLAELEATIVPIDVPGAEEAADLCRRMLQAEAFAVYREQHEAQPELLGEDTRRRLTLGKAVSGADFAWMLQRMHEWRRTLRSVFERVDLVLTPTAPTVAPPIAGAETIATSAALSSFTYPWSYGGNPALSVPAGVSANGLPLGVQLVASPWQDALVLRAGEAYQQATDWHRCRPGSVKGGSSDASAARDHRVQDAR